MGRQAKTRRAAIYVRQSLDRTGDGLAVTRQEALCRSRAEELGWDVVNVYADNSVSASKADVVRPAYQQMLHALGAGDCNAVVVYDLDRLTRRPVELEQFMDLADRHDLALASVDREVDLATDGGRLFARIRGAVARAEVERKGRRQRDANDQRAAAGQPFIGRRAFGYTGDGAQLVEAEAEALREAADRVLAGEGLRTVTRDFSARGIRTTAGNDFHPTQLRRLLQNPRHAGLRVHRGEVIGPGTWPPVFDEDTFRAVGAVLADPARQQPGAPARYLLTSIAVCGTCGATIQGLKQARGTKANVRLYQCRTRRHVVRAADPIDDLVRDVLLTRFAQPDISDLLGEADSDDSRQQLTALQDEQRGLRTRLDGLAEAYAAGGIDAQQLTAGSNRLRSRLEALNGQLTDLLTSSTRTPAVGLLLDGEAEHLRERWEALDIDQQRSLVVAFLSIRLLSPGRGARSFSPDTVDMQWRTAPRFVSH
ncbi:recombinase family protein [Kineococcus sp. SYSU DK002]|uniref:recombinase family protein n=1 Tax=Kineococcus sp. SYSU DK002 TaxID=3383123 RepID=UPI003D7CBEAF